MNTRHIAHSYRERWKLKTDSFKENSEPLRPRIYRQIQENVKQQIIETKDSELEKKPAYNGNQAARNRSQGKTVATDTTDAPTLSAVSGTVSAEPAAQEQNHQ